MALDEAPKGIASNPVIKINSMMEAMQKQQAEKVNINSKVDNYTNISVNITIKFYNVSTTYLLQL